MSTLEIKNLHANVLPTEEGQEPKPILKGVNLTIKGGETHAIMGPNGSGKSTLAYTLAGHPKYEVTEGEVLLDGDTPGTSTGYCMAKKRPARARSSISMSSTFSPSRSTSPSVTSYFGWPARV